MDLSILLPPVSPYNACILRAVSQEQQRALEEFLPFITYVRQHALASASHKSVDTATGAYLAVCHHFGLDPFPPTGIPDITLSIFISYLVAKNYKFGTIKNYLSMGPRTLSIQRSIPWYNKRNLRVYTFTMGVTITSVIDRRLCMCTCVER